MKDLKFTCHQAEIKPNGYKDIELIIEGANASDVLGNFSIEEILEHFDKDELIEAIGFDYIRDNYEL